jgi:HAD superfamily hydrolase (TIGR01490 family)
MNTQKSYLALFDFDGTITSKDTLFLFIRFVVGDFYFIIGILILFPYILAYFFNLLPNYKLKEKLLIYFFKDINEQDFKSIAKKFSLLTIDKILLPKAIDRILWHKNQGHKIIIVTASIDYWVAPWCNKFGLDLIASKLEINNGMITGKLSGKNCYGIEKVKRIKENVDLSKFSYIYSYGNSKGDLQMFDIANESYYKVFD